MSASYSASATPKTVITDHITPKNIIAAFTGITLDEPKIQLSDKPKIQLSDEPKIQLSDEPKIQLYDEPKIQLSDEPKIQLYAGPFDKGLEIEMTNAREIYGNDLDQNLFAKLYYRENNMNLEDLNSLTTEEINILDPEESQTMLNKLAACNCCEVHSCNKPTIFGPWTETKENNESKKNYRYGKAMCKCYCRQVAREICRNYNNSITKTETNDKTNVKTETNTKTNIKTETDAKTKTETNIKTKTETETDAK